MQQFADRAEGQLRTPIIDALRRYRDERVTRFHMPGHKGGRHIEPGFAALLGEGAFAVDVTSVEGMDDLQQPAGIIAAAQELAARTFGADRSYLLVNGTSCGVQAMVMAACDPGSKLIVARNIHKSILAGLILAGAVPVFVQPEVHPSGITLGVPAERVAEALARHPEARGVLLVSPNYHGVASDLQRIARIVHAAGKPLLVDEAHGAHFAFHPGFPPPALRVGADACAQGTHKSLGGLTQAAMLHLRGARLRSERVEAALRLLQSTSASYLLLASLDATRMQMARSGRQVLERVLRLAETARRELSSLPGLSCPREELLAAGADAVDPAKITVRVDGLGLTGQEAELELRHRHRLQVEMSDALSVLLFFGLGTEEDDVAHLIAAFRDLSRRHAGAATSARVRQAMATCASPPPLPPQAMPPRDAFFAETQPVPLDDAVGEAVAETVACYPPGVPIICPGEVLTPEVRDYLRAARDVGLRLQGGADPDAGRVRIVRETRGSRRHELLVADHAL